VVKDFGHRASPKGDHGYPGSHGLDHYKTERFRPVDRKQQCQGSADKGVLVFFADLAVEVNPRMLQQQLDPGLVIGPIDAIDLGRNDQLQPTQ